MIARYRMRHSRECAIYRHLHQRLSRHRGTRVMALVNYRRRAGNLIDRDKRSNCRGRRCSSAPLYFFHVAKYEINPRHTALRVLAPNYRPLRANDKNIKNHTEHLVLQILDKKENTRITRRL